MATQAPLTVPDFGKLVLRETDGTLLDPGTIKGKKVFLNFWATWCRPCIAEMPSIARVKEKISADSVCFLFASAESAAEIEAFAKTSRFPFHFVIIENMEALGITAIPATWIFDQKGKATFSDMGAREWDSPANFSIIKN